MNIRDAKPEDAKQISALMKELGYEASPDLIKAKLLEFDKTSSDEVFVAEADGAVVGSISCHVTRLFHQSGNSGRITSLVINKEKRGLGTGKALVRQAETYFKSKDCIKSEVTSGDHRKEAHAFYESCGYARDERRFIKIYVG